jgi:hypothetical protein
LEKGWGGDWRKRQQRGLIKFSQNFPKKIHYGRISQDILNIPLWNISVASFLHILNFTGWVNYGYFTGDIVKNTLDDPPRNAVGTFFGNILNFPHIS